MSTVSPTAEKDQSNFEGSSPLESTDVIDREESSTSEEQLPEKTTVDAVTEALKLTSKKQDDVQPESDAEDGEKSNKSDEQKNLKQKDDSDEDEITDDELNAMKHKTRKRFEQLQSRYRDVTQEKEELQRKFETSEKEAGYYRNFTKFLNDNNINQDEANILFDIGAMMKNDPNKALQMMTPYYNQLLEVTGNILPRDLQEQVKQGYITEDNALSLSRERAINVNHRARQQIQQNQQQREAEQQRQVLNSNIQSALADLERNWRSDPDYKQTSSRIHERVKLMWFEAARNGQLPNTVDEAVKAVEKIKVEVEQELKSFMPKPKAVSSPNSSSGLSSLKSQPKNTEDVIRYTLGM